MFVANTAAASVRQDLQRYRESTLRALRLCVSPKTQAGKDFDAPDPAVALLNRELLLVA